MPLPQRHDMVQALASDRSDQPFNMTVLPRRTWRDRPISDAHGSQPACDRDTIGGITIADEVARRLVPRECFGDLSGDPFGGRMCGHVDPDETSPLRYTGFQVGKTIRTELDLASLRQILVSNPIDHVVIEQKSPRGRSRASTSTFKFGFSAGSIYDLLVGLQLPISVPVAAAVAACGRGRTDAGRGPWARRHGFSSLRGRRSSGRGRTVSSSSETRKDMEHGLPCHDKRVAFGGSL